MSSNCALLFFTGDIDGRDIETFSSILDVYSALEKNPGMKISVHVDEVATITQYKMLQFMGDSTMEFIRYKLYDSVDDNAAFRKVLCRVQCQIAQILQDVEKPMKHLAPDRLAKAVQQSPVAMSTLDMVKKLHREAVRDKQERTDRKLALDLAGEVEIIDSDCYYTAPTHARTMADKRRQEEADRKLALRLAAEGSEVDMMEIETTPRPLYSQVARGGKSHAPLSGAAFSSRQPILTERDQRIAQIASLSEWLERPNKRK